LHSSFYRCRFGEPLGYFSARDFSGCLGYYRGYFIPVFNCRLNLPHTTPVKNLSPLRITAVVLALAFAVYSAYGIPGNELHLFSGFPPPKSYSIFKTKSAVTPIQNDYERPLPLLKKKASR